MLIVQKKPEIPTNAIAIPLTRGMTAYVSPEDDQLVKQYYWRAVKSSSGYYARARYQVNGKTHTIRMHRLIAKCLRGQIGHHQDHNRLNNTRENLLNQTEREHRHTDGWRYFEH